MSFPRWGNICFDCEVDLNHDLVVRKGKVTIMGRKKDWLKTARGSGHYPMTFNFLLNTNKELVQCSYCGTWMKEKDVTRDHVWPKSKGGLIKTPACEPCNSEKGNMKPIEWAFHATKTGRAIAIIPIGFNYRDGKE